MISQPGTVDIWGWIVPLYDALSVRLRTCYSVPGLYPLDSGSISALPPSLSLPYDNQKCLQILPHVLWGSKLSESHWSILFLLPLFLPFFPLPLLPSPLHFLSPFPSFLLSFLPPSFLPSFWNDCCFQYPLMSCNLQYEKSLF